MFLRPHRIAVSPIADIAYAAKEPWDALVSAGHVAPALEPQRWRCFVVPEDDELESELPDDPGELAIWVAGGEELALAETAALEAAERLGAWSEAVSPTVRWMVLPHECWPVPQPEDPEFARLHRPLRAVTAIQDDVWTHDEFGDLEGEEHQMAELAQLHKRAAEFHASCRGAGEVPMDALLPDDASSRGVNLASLPNAFEPLAKIWALGYGVHAVEDRGITLVAMYHPDDFG